MLKHHWHHCQFNTKGPRGFTWVILQFFNVKQQIGKYFDSWSASRWQCGKTELDVVRTDCWCVCSGIMHAPSAMNVCIVCIVSEWERETERERELSVHTIYSHSGRAYRSGGMDSMSGYHTYLTFGVWHSGSRPDLTLTQILSGKITFIFTDDQWQQMSKREVN